MVYSEVVGLSYNQKLIVYLVHPENLSFISIIVFENGNFEEDQMAKR